MASEAVVVARQGQQLLVQVKKDYLKVLVKDYLKVQQV